MNICKKIYCYFIVFFLAAFCGAQDIHVATNGPGPSPFGTWDTASSNIEWAVNTATNGDTVWISNGVYVLTNQVTVNSNITICGTGGVVVVDGNGANRCFYFNSGVTGALENLFITGGYTNGSGGGVVFRSGIVRDCVFSNNICTNTGGGILLEANSTIQRCTFIDNKAYYGGGMDCSGPTTLVDNCLFQTNIAGANGGGLYTYSSQSHLTVTGCDFICNVSTGIGGGGSFSPSYSATSYTSLITHCTFSRNVSMNRGGGLAMSYNTVVLSNSFISNNIAFISGGGIYANNRVLITKCVIARNTSKKTGGNQGGGGVFARYNPMIQNSTIEENIAGAGGAGVFIETGGGTLRNCLIRNNYGIGGSYGAYGGGIRVSGIPTTISSCTIVSNHAVVQGGGIRSDVGAQVDNCIVYYNTCGNALTYSNWYNSSDNFSCSNSCIAPALTNGIASNNITADPMCIDRAGGNYHLSRESPCVNAGVNQDWMDGMADLDGHWRVDKFGGIVDMGCYEYLPSGVLFIVR